MSHPDIRRAAPADVPEILRLVRELAAYEKEPDAVETTEEDFVQALFPAKGEPTAHCHVAEAGEGKERRVVGLALWYLTFSTWTGKNGIHLEDLYVEPRHRGSGLGKELIAELAAVRKHAGAIVPFPVQAAMTYALSVDEHEAEQRARYAARRAVLLQAVRGAGFTVDHSEAGLYLWSTRGEPCRDTVDWFADRGILVAPGEFYGPRGASHVRIALTATDERIGTAAQRLA